MEEDSDESGDYEAHASDHGRRDVGGMDPRQAQAAREHAATREHRRRRDEGGGVKGMSGLPNLGNTCYLNAALQALVHTKPFADFFTECPEFLPPHIDGNSHQRSAQRRLLHSLSDVIHQVWQTGSKTASPHNFVRDVLDLNPDYRGLGQQDSQEFLRRTLDVLHEELASDIPPLDTDLPGNSTGGEGEGEGGKEGGEAENGSEKPNQDNRKGKAKRKSSIILDIFAGKVVSEVKCSVCGKVSVTEEPILDQSISIPAKKARQRLAAGRAAGAVGGRRPASAGSAKSGASGGRGGGVARALTANGEDAEATCATTGWLSFLFGIFAPGGGRADLDPVSLRDCLRHYYEPEQLSGSDRYKCEGCNKLQESTKKLSLLKPPEVMTLHIKRFRYDTAFGSSIGSKINEHVEFPLNDLDMRPFTKDSTEYSQSNNRQEQADTIYDLQALVEHRGSLNGGHYVAYVKSGLDDKWYEYDDSIVRRVSEPDVLRCEGYMLFYRLRASAAKVSERREIMAAIEKSDEQECDGGSMMISRLWLLRFCHLVNPGPIDNSHFVCKHGNFHLKDKSIERQEQMIRMVPLAVWDTLHAKYGGGPCIPSDWAQGEIECKECAREAAALHRRRQHEQELVQENDKTYIEAGNNWYIVDKIWLQSWLSFVHPEQQGPVPGPISNARLLKRDGITPKDGLLKGQNYRGVNRQVWDIFHEIYGGGPPIVRARLDIYADAVPAR